MTTLEKQFAVAYYTWSKSEFQSEIDRGFPVLSRLRCSFSLDAYDSMSAMPRNQQILLASSFLKFGHRDATNELGDPMTKEEEDLLHQYRNSKTIDTFVGPLHYHGPSGKTQEGITDAIKAGRLTRQTATASFRASTVQKISEIVGGSEQIRNFLANSKAATTRIECKTELGDWTIASAVEFTRKFPLSYSQYLLTRRDPMFFRNVSILQSFGILGQTYWDLLTTDVADETIEMVARLCHRFVSQAPLWLPMP